MLESKAVSKPARMNSETAPTNTAQTSILSETDLFKSIDRTTLGGIEQSCRYRRFAAQEQIIDKDSPSADVFFIVRGRARVVN